MLKYETTGLQRTANSQKDMARRAERLDDGAADVHDALLSTVQPINENTGRLAASFAGGADHVFRMNAGTIIFGSAVPYAKFYFARTSTVPFDPDDAAQASATALKDFIRGESG